MNHKLYKLLHWEYWPEYLVYWPAWLFWPYYAVRLKSVFFFSLANPGIRNGGIMDIDKYFLYQQIHLKYLPKSILLKPTDDCCKIELLNQYNLALPLIAKPNNGYRGKKVEKIITLEQLNAYHLATNFDYLLQEFCNLPDEIGVFYCKLPHQEIGTITGIVHKQFMQVVGDGINTVKHLIKANPRYAFQLNRLSATIDMQSIPSNKEVVVLEEIGSHNRGAKFVDISYYNTPALLKTIDIIAKNINGFNYGRMDIKCKIVDGKILEESIIVLEVNGVSSEPTHIYDPKHSYLFALKEIRKHHQIMYAICKANKSAGAKSLTFNQGWQDYKQFQKNKLLFT